VSQEKTSVYYLVRNPQFRHTLNNLSLRFTYRMNKIDKKWEGKSTPGATLVGGKGARERKAKTRHQKGQEKFCQGGGLAVNNSRCGGTKKKGGRYGTKNNHDRRIWNVSKVKGGVKWRPQPPRTTRLGTSHKRFINKGECHRRIFVNNLGGFCPTGEKKKGISMVAHDG